jgi:proteasome alpha subunit
MPFYVSPQQQMQDKANYAQQGVARGRSCVALQYAGGILFVAPNASNALHKISELYDRIGFAAVGRYNEYENLRKAGVTYADIMGYQFDRNDVTARGIANYYAQQLGTLFIELNKPYEVELVVAEVGADVTSDQIYRITFEGSVTDERGYVAFGGDAGKLSAALKERYAEGMTLAQAFGTALAGLNAQSAATGAGSSGSGSSSAGSSGSGAGAAGRSASTNGAAASQELTANQLEVAILDRTLDHRKFRRIRGARLDDLLAEARALNAPAPESPAAPETPTDPGPAE